MRLLLGLDAFCRQLFELGLGFGVAVAEFDAKNVGRIIETERGAMLSNVTIENCRAFGIVRGFSRIYHLSNGVFRNLELDAANFDAGTPNVCQLLAVDAGDNILFEDVTLKNALNVPTPKAGKKEGYVQGDGITCETTTPVPSLPSSSASACVPTKDTL